MPPACQLLASGELLLLPDRGIPRKLTKAFQESPAAGLLSLATDFLEDETLPPELTFWRDLAREYLIQRCQSLPPPTEAWNPVPAPATANLERRCLTAPPFPGSEELDPALLSGIWRDLDERTQRFVAEEETDIEAWLQARHPLWRQVGRVTFHLAENSKSESHPFAFLATYTHRVSAQAKLQYLPLGKALKSYSSEKNASVLQALLKPVHQAAQESGLTRELLESRRVFQVLAWTPDDAFRFLRDVHLLEQAGLIVKVPDWWKAGRPSRPTVQVNVDTRETTSVGLQAMLQFNVQLALEGQELTAEEWDQIRHSEGGLISIKGKWVEVDPHRLQQALDHWERAERASSSGLTFLEGMRLLAGFQGPGGSAASPSASHLESFQSWTRIKATGDFEELLQQLQAPSRSPSSQEPSPNLCATLRPYQREGLDWLCLTHTLGLGACLADDMGLGKTIQVIAFLLHLKDRAQTEDSSQEPSGPSLLVVPASLIGNWRREFDRFAPTLQIRYEHPSQTAGEETSPPFEEFDAILTTYGMLRRRPELANQGWNLVILDEAQAIKNPASQQTRAVKRLSSRHRLALTGTPIENNVTDLWSLFDFLNPGLLGSATRFGEAVKVFSQDRERGFLPLRQLVSPYILRRLKSNPAILPDLPDKIEMRTDCGLTKGQATLYQKSVRELASRLRDPAVKESSIERKGLVLTYLMRFKQICNHTALWTGSGNFDPASSGKFARLASLADVIRQRGEKLLVFTQFREMTGPLAEYLETLFHRPGLILHGGTAVKRRQDLVDRFQDPAGPPFFVISLKAGGTGLNLTAANHVVHFDRWWNPAVEDQATDRAYRIGQRNKVMVHKFVCPGTVEDRIDRLMREKKQLAAEIVASEQSSESLLARMNDEELLNFVQLDLDQSGI